MLLRVPPRQRFTSAVAWGEFLCNVRAGDAAERITWLTDKQIRVLPLTQSVTTSFVNLAHPPVQCDALRDLLIAATAMAGDYALATEDHDFDRLGPLTTVVEFARQ